MPGGGFALRLPAKSPGLASVASPDKGHKKTPPGRGFSQLVGD